MSRWGRRPFSAIVTALAAGSAGLSRALGGAARDVERAVPPAPAPAVPKLPSRKLQIVRLVASGLSNKEIARELTIKERTVEAHLEQLRGRLGLRNRAQLAVWAVVQGLVTEDETPDRWGKVPESRR